MRHNEIQDLIKLVSKSGVSEVHYENDKVKLIIKNDGGRAKLPEVQTIAVPQVVAAPASFSAPVSAVAAAPVAPSATPSVSKDESKYITIKSPMIGTAYRKPTPDKPDFVNVGDEIKAGDVLCIIEAMKLFNEIEAEVTGKVVKILFDDETPVEYDQALFLVDPS